MRYTPRPPAPPHTGALAHLFTRAFTRGLATRNTLRLPEGCDEATALAAYLEAFNIDRFFRLEYDADPNAVPFFIVNATGTITLKLWAEDGLQARSALSLIGWALCEEAGDLQASLDPEELTSHGSDAGHWWRHGLLAQFPDVTFHEEVYE